MTRYIAVLFAALAIFASLPAYAQHSSEPRTSSDPEHRGYIREMGDVTKMEWYNIEAECEECDVLADSYNKVMTQVYELRYQIAVIENMEDKHADLQDLYDEAEKAGKDGLDATGEAMATMILNSREAVDEMQAQIPAIRTQLGRLEDMGKSLLKQLDICEQQQCRTSGPETPRAVSVGGGTSTVSAGVPFPWRGPYPEVCVKCAKLAARLNELPNLARKAMAQAEAARAEILSADIAIKETRARDMMVSAGGHKRGNAESDKWLNDWHTTSIREAEAKKDKAQDDLRKAESDIAEITRNFEQTLELYNKCTPTCPKQTGMVDPGKDDDTALALGGDYSKDLKGCTLSYLPGESYVIGANSEYGTGAAMKDKMKSTATGMAMGALGGFGGSHSMGMGSHGGDAMTGGGIGREGMGGGSSGPKGPDLAKNPLKGDWYHLNSSYKDWDIGVRLGYTDDGLLVNQRIFDSPGGDSTFHATWLEDSKGQKLLPSQYYVYSIYQDHKLTMWWTYDHWTDGVHDDHDEGREVTQWRTNLGDFGMRYGGNDGAKNSLWYNSGYDTAVKGVREMGAFYYIKPQDLTGCPVGVVTHYTEPGEDPVRTHSEAFGVKLNANKGLDVTDALGLNGLSIMAPQDLKITGKVEYKFKWDPKPVGTVKPTYLDNFRF